VVVQVPGQPPVKLPQLLGEYQESYPEQAWMVASTSENTVSTKAARATARNMPRSAFINLSNIEVSPLTVAFDNPGTHEH
jgi:hypothetical protein